MMRLKAWGAATAILPLQLSSASERDYELLLDTLDRQFGRLDGILHNAGILGERVPLADYPVNVWDDVMAVNLRAPFVITQALLPCWKNPNTLLWSLPGVWGVKPGMLGRLFSFKIAIEAVSQLFAKERVNSNIRFNCINPGATRTAMRAKAYRMKIRKPYRHRIPSCQPICT